MIEAAPARLLARTLAFQLHGVTLKYPSRSWGGVRHDDGAVVLAMRSADVLSDRQGSRCLLWSPHMTAGPTCVDRASREERLEQCRLACVRGGAEGLLAYGDAGEIHPHIVLPLRVMRMRGEYWARWRAHAAPRHIAPAVLEFPRQGRSWPPVAP